MAESLKEHTRSFLNGVVSGIASILPGVSGGLILVLCGSYERLIEDIGHLRSKLVPEFWFLVAIGCGLLVGMGSCMVFLDWALDGYAAPMMAFFFGLILAQIPQVWKLTGYSENTRNPVIPWICLRRFCITNPPAVLPDKIQIQIVNGCIRHRLVFIVAYTFGIHKRQAIIEIQFFILVTDTNKRLIRLICMELRTCLYMHQQHMVRLPF